MFCWLSRTRKGSSTTLVPLRPGGRALPAHGRDPARRRDQRVSLRCDAILLGAVGHPRVAPGILEKGILLRLRFDFQQYINLRPIQLFPGVECPIRGKGPDDVDMVVVRENNEDLYVGAGGFTRKGTPEEVAIQTSINTRRGVERTLRYAFDLARRRAAFWAVPRAFRRRSRPGIAAPGDPGGQDKRAHLRPRPVDARLHRSRRANTRRSRATISTWTPVACEWSSIPSGST